MNPGRRATLPYLVVALEDMPPEGLARPLNLSPVVLAALLAEDGGEPPSLVSDLTGTLRLRRLGARLEVRGSFRVEAGLVCDRCLAPATLVLTGEIEESPFLAAADGRSEQAEEDVLVVTDGQVDLAGLLAESFWLAWPYRFTCRPDCAGLCPACGADLNQGACGCLKPV